MKKIIIVGIILTITSIGSYKYLTNNEEVTNEITENTNMLTMMLETEDGNYVETTANDWPPEGYVFNAELSKCENGGIVTFNEETQKINMQTNISDKCYVYFDIANQTFANYIIENVYTEDGVNGLYYHDGIGTYTNANQEAGDNSYRYSGANPNNYVCFGSDEAICPNNNLYRIIGLFDDDQDRTYNVKLIKADYATTTDIGSDGTYDSENKYKWTNEAINSWEKSELNTINLNTNFLNKFDSKWLSLIENYKWSIDGAGYDEGAVKNFFIRESSNKSYENYIGLMYVSDYGYAASPEKWSLDMYANSSQSTENWLYMWNSEWTITPSPSQSLQTLQQLSNSDVIFLAPDPSEGNDQALAVKSNGIDSPYVTFTYCIRPVFYLKSDVIFVDGNGTASNPYKIDLG